MTLLALHVGNLLIVIGVPWKLFVVFFVFSLNRLLPVTGLHCNGLVELRLKYHNKTIMKNYLQGTSQTYAIYLKSCLRNVAWNIGLYIRLWIIPNMDWDVYLSIKPKCKMVQYRLLCEHGVSYILRRDNLWKYANNTELTLSSENINEILPL